MQQKKTRRQLHNEENMRNIISQARRLFAARGFEAVTVDDICAAANVGKSTFYNLFDSKDDLLMVAAGEERNQFLQEAFVYDDTACFKTQLFDFLQQNFFYNIKKGAAHTRLEYKSYLLTGSAIPSNNQHYHDVLYRLIDRGLQQQYLSPALSREEYFNYITDTLIGLLIGWAVRADTAAALSDNNCNTTLQMLISSLIQKSN